MFSRGGGGGSPSKLQVKLQYKNQEFAVPMDLNATFGELRVCLFPHLMTSAPWLL